MNRLKRLFILSSKRSYSLFGLAFTLPIAGLFLAGCAAQRAFNDGKELVAQDKVEAGLEKFHQAMLADPNELQYKAAYLQTRERSINAYLEQADRLTNAGKNDQAEKLYQRVLVLNPGNDRAEAGLKKIKMDTRHSQLIKDIETALNTKDTSTAKLKLAAILTENPDHVQAQAIQRMMQEKTTKAPAEFGLAPAYKKPISIEFKDVSLKQIFEVISRSSGLNFLFDKEVKTDQKASIFLKNSTIESAVHFLLLTNQLELQVLDANTILIYPNTVAKQKDYQEMVIRSFFLTNAEAKTVANTLKTLLKTRDIVVDEKLNMLIVRDSPEAIKLAEKLVALHDVAEPEVMLEVEILEIKRTRLLQLGIQWPGSLSLTPLSLNATSASTSSGSTSNSLTLRDLRHQNLGTIGASLSSTTVNANNQDSDANLLANPRIRTRNHEKAKILIGERVPNITTTATSTGFVSESINYVDVGLTLNVEPTIYLDNDVGIKIALEVSNIVSQLKTQSGSTAYQIGTRTASTALRLKDGETQVLAGLINDEDRRSGNKIPGVGDFPVIGRLFGSSTDDNQKTEIVLSITPHLIRNIQRPDNLLAEFRSGTETSFRLRPDSGGASTATAPNTLITPTPTTLTLTPASITPEPNPSSTTGALLQWQGPAKVRAGDAFSIQLEMKSDKPVTGLALALGFDKQLLQVVGMNEGNFLKEGGAQSSFTSRIDPSGQILMTSTRSSKESGATHLGRVATINFRTLATADSAQVQVLSIAPTGIGGTTIAVQPPLPFAIQIQP